MNEAAVSAILAVGAQATPAAAQPTAEQAARFQTLLQQPDAPALELASYSRPLAPPVSIDSQLQPLADYAAEISDHMREYMQPPRWEVDATRFPELHTLQRLAHETRAINVMSLQVQLIGKSVNLVNESVQALYQRV